MQIVTVRPGVQFTPDAAASFRRVEAEQGYPIDVNSTFRDPTLQLKMYEAWEDYVHGRGPYPGHSRALHPRDSVHCKGEALDSDDWVKPGFNERMERHGWVRTAASDPTEQHHYEYFKNRDLYYGTTPVVPIEKEEEQIMDIRQIHFTEKGKTTRALLVPGTPYFMPWTENGATYANNIAKGMDTGSSVEVTRSLFNAFKAVAERCAPKGHVTIEVVDA